MSSQTIKFHMKPETFKQNAAISCKTSLCVKLTYSDGYADDQAQSRFDR